jgi:hypothetical protein
MSNKTRGLGTEEVARMTRFNCIDANFPIISSCTYMQLLYYMTTTIWQRKNTGLLQGWNHVENISSEQLLKRTL